MFFSLTFIIKLLRQASNYFESYLAPVKVIRKATGEGIYDGYSIVVLERAPYLQNNILLTLFCKSSGANQPICILRIVSIHNGEAFAIVSIPNESDINLNQFFEEHARREGLFALPLVDNEVVALLQT